MSPRRTGSGPAVLMVLGSCVSLQVGAASAAQLFPAMGSAGVTLLRLLVAAALLLVVTRPHLHRWTGRQWAAVTAFGLCLAGMNASFYAAIARIPLGTAVTIEFLGPLVLAAVLSRRVRDTAWVLLAAAGVVLLGLAAHAGAGSGLDRVGVAFALLAGVFWAGYILTSARVGAAVPGQGGLAVALAVGSLALVPVGAAGAAAAIGRPDLLLLAAVTGLLASVVPYTLELSALRRLTPSVFGVLLSLEPAVAALAGWVLLAQPLGAREAAAVALVVLASIGSTIFAHRPVGEPPAPPADPGQAPAAVERRAPQLS
ncbi:inner membrane transporter RhtA [Geodermatophilus saharensis]|uniref:Inner membrane transporter RhtA n=1 Tax=Geodermatophilus saharensis TaxID=1137994 RepID=A0A238ZZ46_9ACTN|nr:EamA family transporter [Geodermatophilus saharensis]SNR88422.1 inner membrane transporter RhtA [Geodermatophilus saharensis]